MRPNANSLKCKCPMEAWWYHPTLPPRLGLPGLPCSLGAASACENPTHSPSRSRAEKWLLAARGETFVPDRRIYGHDTTIAAWPWIDHTHSWVEPTSYAVLALRTGGMNSHPRVRDGVAVLLDRAIPGGGWNYGNRRMFGADLRPFPGPTGVALTALAAEHPSTQVSEAITYLAAELTNVRALSLAWGLIGLTACNRRPAQADEWLEETAGRIRARKLDRSTTRSCFWQAAKHVPSRPPRRREPPR